MHSRKKKQERRKKMKISLFVPFLVLPRYSNHLTVLAADHFAKVTFLPKSFYLLTKTERLNNTHAYIYIYIYILCHPQADCFVVPQLFRVVQPARCFKLRLKPGWLWVSQISSLKAIIILSISERIFYVNIFTYTFSTTWVLSSYKELLHFTVCGSWQISHSRAQPTVGEHIYIYIYI